MLTLPGIGIQLKDPGETPQALDMDTSLPMQEYLSAGNPNCKGKSRSRPQSQSILACCML